MKNTVVHLKSLLIAAFCSVALASYSSNVDAVTPSPAMIAQFQKLPKAEQQRLMKQYGISPGMLNSNVSIPPTVLENPSVVQPRIEPFQENKTVKEVKVNSSLVIKKYGYDIFEGEPSTFAPVSDIPVPAEYLMGPGDVVNVQIYGKENQTYSLTVSRSGMLDLPNSGPVSVNGLSFESLQEQLGQKIEEQFTGVKANISLGELRSIRIIITGEAYKPGSYTVSSLSTITQALFVSGGVSDIASLRNIQLKRAGKKIVTFDLYDLLMKGDAKDDVRLQSGDVIFIPPVGNTATVKGDVRRPAIYELKGNETAKDLIMLAAGLKANAYPKASVIERYSEQFLPTLLNIDLTNKLQQKTKIRDGDILTVQSTTNKIKNQVLVAGSVSRPGFYQWRSGMRISDLISSQWSDLKGVVDLKYALLTREVNLQADIETRQFSLAKIFEDKNSSDNLYLKPRDTLIIFSQTGTIAEALVTEKRNKKRNVTSNNRESFNEINAEIYEVDEDELEELSEKEDLSKLYKDKSLIKRSSEFTRQTLLRPIIDQLKSQDLVNGVTNVASISGEVRFPGEYPVSKNARVSDLVAAAGGIKESAFIKQAELTKFHIDADEGASVHHQSIALNNALNGIELDNLLVESRDHLTILKIPAWQENMTVTLKGEVKFPGTYSVREGETLDSVIKRAGGYTEQAFLEGAVFTRESVKEQELTQIIKFADQLRLDIAAKGLSGDNSVAFSEASLMLKELESLQAVGRMVVSLSKENNSKHNDLLVEDGDMLHVPSQKQTVTVVGEVQHASTHFFEDGISFHEYITKAGGIKKRADDSRAYIIRANGSVVIPESNLWFSAKAQIKPGDTIVVPLDTEYKDNLELWSQVTSIIYNVAVAVRAVQGL
ncbi:SLBB domain-containing protein [Psychrobium sp. MM17-31]|uniref:SLBB domain-containing protein n=1 Tax=Psychrobium sp. MM17-31 TaxID=2917758 RepID=UPI001EF67083|nr:SLBB domain-containing protein [Psychrobium sp. MM17-31]MCG7531162.1 SLBB domain-containing protein [Psychrobium sp. MM17-31]